MQKLPPRSLSTELMTGLDGEPSPDTPVDTFEESRRTQIEEAQERRKASG